MRRLLPLLALLALAAAIPAASAHTAKPKTHTVKVGDDFFSPKKKTIHVKDVVKWVWVDENGKPGETFNEHTVTDSKGRFTSKQVTSGVYRFRFKKAGKYTILCAVHETTMRMTVTVKK